MINHIRKGSCYNLIVPQYLPKPYSNYQAIKPLCYYCQDECVAQDILLELLRALCEWF